MTLASLRWLCVFLMLFVGWRNGWAGKLGSFEEDATKKKPRTSKSDDQRRDEERRRDADDDDDDFVRIKTQDDDDDDDRKKETSTDNVILPLGRAMADGGELSWALASGEEETPEGLPLAPRKPGKVLIPFLSVGFNYQDVESDVHALDYHLEGGYGPVSVHFNLSHFKEDEPNDTLDLYRIHALYRMLLSRDFEWDIGFGALTIDGTDENTGFSFTSPLIFRPEGLLALEFRPAWADVNGTSIADYDVSLLFGPRYTFLRAGYRWVESDTESLNGPYGGISLRY